MIYKITEEELIAVASALELAEMEITGNEIVDTTGATEAIEEANEIVTSILNKGIKEQIDDCN